MMTPYFRLLRPQHWIKNGFVLAPVIFAEKMLDPHSLVLALSAFAVFCVVSSGAYVFNDVVDRERDRSHPLKMNRPVASGAVSVQRANIIGTVLSIAGILAAFSIGKGFLGTVILYLMLQLAYNGIFRKVVILDIFIIAIGFVLRALGGSVAIGVEISPWLILCTLLVALFLGFSKRRHEIVLLGDSAVEHRMILGEYSIQFLDQLIGIVTATTIVSYAIYTLSPEVTTRLGSRYMILTLPFVVYGIFRYLYLIHIHEKGGSPTKDLMADGPLLICILLWGALSVGLIYGF
jgi:4-hydroxybenzoate polyprenyltransferase